MRQCVYNVCSDSEMRSEDGSLVRHQCVSGSPDFRTRHNKWVEFVVGRSLLAPKVFLWVASGLPPSTNDQCQGRDQASKHPRPPGIDMIITEPLHQNETLCQNWQYNA